jgi:hypothetical protein
MATLLGSRLPEELMSRLATRRGELEGTAVPICTIDAEGFPHPAMLSYGELAADAPDAIRAALHEGSTTARNLRKRPLLTLLFVDACLTCYVKVRASGVEAPHPRTPGVAIFSCVVEAVMMDYVDVSREPAATIVTGITFRRAAAGTTL